jgi:PIN domain nuclease of toxin-antitoxin system
MKKGYIPDVAWTNALSLGDRACLALAIALKAPVYTTELLWKNLKLGVPIYLIR